MNEWIGERAGDFEKIIISKWEKKQKKISCWKSVKITWQRSLSVHVRIRIVPNLQQIVSSMVRSQQVVDSVAALQLSLLG